MKLWLDDMRPAPQGYRRVTNVNEAKMLCCQLLNPRKILCIEEFNLDHDAGKYASMGGDYIEILKYLEEKHFTDNWVIKSTFKFHSMNPVGVQSMKKICEYNNWIIERN